MADLCVCGVWQPQCEAVFDKKVVDTDGSSYCSQSPQFISAESEKKKYLKACHDCRVGFLFHFVFR